MTLFIAEMRKIWRPTPIAILIAMAALWAFVGVIPDYQSFTANERNAGFLPLDLTSERRLITRYGPLTDSATIDAMKADIPRLEQQATRDIQAHPDAAKTLGISDFAGYKRWYSSVSTQTFYPTDAPNTIPAGHTSTGAITAEGAAMAAEKEKNDPTANMSDEEQSAMWDAERTLSNSSEALQDLQNIALLMSDFPITQADAQKNLDSSVAMMRSTADTDHPVTALQKQFEQDYQTEAANGWSTPFAVGCAATDITGKTTTNETTSGTANNTNENAENNTNSNGANSSVGNNTTNNSANASNDTNNNADSNTNNDAQLGEGCNPADASLGLSSYRIPGTMPTVVTNRLAYYAAHPGQSSYLQYSIVEHTWGYASVVAVFAVIASAAFTIPVMVRDRSRRITPLQWASRSGRAGQRARIAAMTVSALLIGILTLVIFGMPLVMLLHDFMATPVLNLNSNVSIGGINFYISLGNPIVPWNNWTFGQYLAIIGVTIIVLTLAITMIGGWLCQPIRSVIRMLLVVVPLLALILLPAQLIYFPNMFLMGNWLTNRLTVPNLELWLPLAVLAIAILAWMFSSWRLHRREYMC